MELKDLIQNIIKSLNDNCSIETIMLQAQTIAHYLKDESFKIWLQNEQNGYKKTAKIPAYRLLECRVKLKVVDGNCKYHDDFDFVVGNLKDEHWENYFFNIEIRKSLPELERYVNNGGMFKQPINAELYPIIEEKLNNSVIQSADKEVLTANIASIIFIVKTKLLTFFLRINDELNMNVDFTKTGSWSQFFKSMNMPNNSTVICTGEGNINICNSDFVVGQGNKISCTNDLTKELNLLIEKLKKIEADNIVDKQDISEGIITLQKEVNQKELDVGIIRRTIRMLKTIPSIIATHGIEICMDELLTFLK